MRLDPAAVAADFHLSAHETLGSTNAEALALARRGAAGPCWVTARQQSAGRGRRGRAWISDPGNLYATLLLVDPARLDVAPELSFVAGLAVHDAIKDCVPSLERLALKWPNDVLYGGEKLAGILIESEIVDERLSVAVGIGVNCMRHPAQTSFPATDLAAAGVNVSPEKLFYVLSATMMRRLDQWNHGDGFGSIRADWLARAAGIGGEMVVRLPGRELSGRGETLDDKGRLLLRLADGRLQAIAAGDIFPIAERDPVVRLPQARRAD